MPQNPYLKYQQLGIIITIMISEYVFANIDQHFNKKTLITPSKSSQAQTQSLTCPAKPPLTHLIKQHLPTLIRRNNDPPIHINQTKRKSPSPISKSRLKTVLESSKLENLKSVIKRSPIKSTQLTSKSSVSDLLSCKSSQGRSVSEYEDDKENTPLDAYCQRRKNEEIRKQVSQKSMKKVLGKQH